MPPAVCLGLFLAGTLGAPLRVAPALESASSLSRTGVFSRGTLPAPRLYALLEINPSRPLEEYGQISTPVVNNSNKS